MVKYKRIKEHECKRCNHTWFPRKKHKPKRCPKCNSPYWDKLRRKDLVSSLLKNMSI